MAALKSNEVIWAGMFLQGNLTEGREREKRKLLEDLLIFAHEVKCQLDDSATPENFHSSADFPSWQTAINHSATWVAIIF